MSTPVQHEEDVEPLMLYAPRRQRQARVGSSKGVGARRLVASAPPTVPDITLAPGSSIAGEEAPPIAPGPGGASIKLSPPRAKPFEGDVAMKDLRDRLSRDPHLVPEPPMSPCRRSFVPWVGRWIVVLGLAAGVGFAVRLTMLPRDMQGERWAALLAPVPASDLASRATLSALAPRLTIESQRASVNEPLPLGIAVHSGGGDETLTLVGFAAGTRLSAGVPLGSSGWKLQARDVGAAFAQAPGNFIGAMDVAVDLRSARDRIVDSQLLRLEWLPKNARAAIRIAPAAVAAPPLLSVEEVATLIKRGEEFLKAGDVPSARIALRRAVAEGNAKAALLLGATFDPLLLAEHGVIGFASDPVQARNWYQRAAELGASEAPRRLERLAGL